MGGLGPPITSSERPDHTIPELTGVRSAALIQRRPTRRMDNYRTAVLASNDSMLRFVTTE